MVFSSYVFLFLFLPVLFLFYYGIPKQSRNGRNMVLLIFSIIFYGWGGPKYLLVLAISILINWIGGILIYRFQKDRKEAKRIALIITIAANCLLLGFFKYTDFMIGNINSLFGLNIPLQHIVLPIGISFYTFQGMSYVFDVYKNGSLCLKNPLMVALYITLFPQLVAGPIVRFADVATDLRHRVEKLDDIVNGLQRFIFGLAKKIILADTFGIVADQAFTSTSLTVGMAWLGAIAYALQIYFDFSGYSDMAIGLGRVFGFRFPENFNYPYISASITEFWRRWHISLSSWFRDYIYIPLGGNRCSKIRQLFNMAVVWSLTGLWHGANWTFVLWGMYYLMWLALEKFIMKEHLEKIHVSLRRIGVLLIIICGWVLFRAENLSGAVTYIKIMFCIGNVELGLNELGVNISNYISFWILGIFAATPFPKKVGQKLMNKYSDSIIFSGVKMLYVLGILFVSVCYIIASSYNAFIYFQF